MNDALLVRVLNGRTDLHEELEPLHDRQAVLVAVSGDRRARHVLHREERMPVRSRAGIIDGGDRRMLQQGQGLPLGLEACQHQPGAHAGLDDLQRDRAAHGSPLFGEVDESHAALAEQPHRAIGPEGRHRRRIGGSIGAPGFRLRGVSV